MDEALKVLMEAVKTTQTAVAAVELAIKDLLSRANDQKWVSLRDGAEALGPAFSEDKLREDIRGGFLEYGKHYLDTSNGTRANYAVSVAALREFYCTPPESRSR